MSLATASGRRAGRSRCAGDGYGDRAGTCGPESSERNGATTRYQIRAVGRRSLQGVAFARAALASPRRRGGLDALQGPPAGPWPQGRPVLAGGAAGVGPNPDLPARRRRTPLLEARSLFTWRPSSSQTRAFDAWLSGTCRSPRTPDRLACFSHIRLVASDKCPAWSYTELALLPLKRGLQRMKWCS